VATEISINFISIDSNNEWQIPDDWDPHLFDEPVSENLNEFAEYWNDVQNLEFIVKKFVSPPDFLTNPEFDIVHIRQVLKERSSAARTFESLPREWIELGKTLQSLDVDPCVIAVPHGMTPWAWYGLTEDEQLSQMGLSDTHSLRSDGVLGSEINSFYFDTYRFGAFAFNLVEEMDLEAIAADPRFISYSQEIMNRGPDSGFHTTCDERCAFRPCSRIIHFPASISLW
jgi:hypothetical protein